MKKRKVVIKIIKNMCVDVLECMNKRIKSTSMYCLFNFTITFFTSFNNDNGKEREGEWEREREKAA